MGERRAEERHDAVAHHLVDRALVVMDGVHHQREDGIEKLARLFRIAVGEQLHRALQIGEENRDLLTLAFERGLRGEDLLGEVPGGVDLWNVEPRPARVGCRTSLGQPLATLLAKLGAQLVRGVASRAGRLKA